MKISEKFLDEFSSKKVSEISQKFANKANTSSKILEPVPDSG